MTSLFEPRGDRLGLPNLFDVHEESKEGPLAWNFSMHVQFKLKSSLLREPPLTLCYVGVELLETANPHCRGKSVFLEFHQLNINLI